MKLFAELHVLYSTALLAVIIPATQYVLYLCSLLSFKKSFDSLLPSKSLFCKEGFMISVVTCGSPLMMVPLQRRTCLTAAQCAADGDVHTMTMIRGGNGCGRQPGTFAGYETCDYSRLPE